MRRVDLLEGQMRDCPRHALAQVCGERRVAEGLDEEDGGGDVSVENAKFVLVVDFTSAVPVYCLCCVS